MPASIVINETRILREIWLNPGVSRIGIARSLRLSKAAVTNIHQRPPAHRHLSQYRRRLHHRYRGGNRSVVRRCPGSPRQQARYPPGGPHIPGNPPHRGGGYRAARGHRSAPRGDFPGAIRMDTPEGRCSKLHLRGQQRKHAFHLHRHAGNQTFLIDLEISAVQRGGDTLLGITAADVIER